MEGKSAPFVSAIVVHDSESGMDLEGEDHSAENVARFIQRRTDAAGSYHEIGDSDSVINLVPLASEAFHSRYGNQWSIGISFAARTTDFQALDVHWRDSLPVVEVAAGHDREKAERIDAALRRMAARVNELRAWVLDTYQIAIPVERINRDEYMAGVPGFISHGEIDPGRRSDPGPYFPWEYFLWLIKTRPAPASVSTLTAEELNTQAMQTQLINLGFDLGRWGADGKFGPATMAAVNRALMIVGYSDELHAQLAKLAESQPTKEA